MAAVNEVIWRTQSDEFWLTWKLVSMIGGPILLSICLLPFLMKNMITDPTADDSADSHSSVFGLNCRKSDI